MSPNKKSGLPGANRPRKPSSKYITTKSGNVIKVKRSLGERWRERSDAKARRKAERLRGLPKSRFKRVLWRLNPRRQAAYWLSRDGRIMALKVTGIGIIVLFVFTLGIFAYFRKDLPNLRDISGGNIGGSIRYFDRTGKILLWEDYGAVKRIPITFEEMPQNIKDATLAIEDRDFYDHRGFNTKGIFRAGLNNAFGSGGTQGGSTITQQLVKLTQDWTRDRSVQRKIKELILAVELERTYSKTEIFQGYLNVAPYGGIEYGVEAASQNYFHKSAKDLTLDEAAMLAAIPKAPRFYSPYSPDFDKPSFVGRQHYILDAMFEMGKINKKQLEDAKKIDTVTKVKPRLAKYDGIRAPYFVLAAKDQLVNERCSGTNGVCGGWKVTTTLDMHLQNIAEDEVTKGMSQVLRQGGNKAAFVAEDVRTGQVMSMVGGPDFYNKDQAGQFNFATRPLPPGSSFKPYDYISLIEHSDQFGAGSVLYDTQGPLEGYPCTNKSRPPPVGQGNCMFNYDFRYPGPLTLRYALGGSRNVPAVKAMLITGIDKTIKTAESLGLDSGYKCYKPGAEVGIKENESQCYAASAIGDGAYLKLDEHVHAYSTISRNGTKIPQTFILKIEDSQGKKIDEWKQSQGQQVVRPESAYIVADMMSDPRASYMGNKPHNFNGHKFSVKTGTTNDSKDGWLMGFSTYYAAGVWVGHHTGNVEMSGFMENMTQPIWSGWMRRAHENLQPLERTRPSGIQVLPAYVVRNHVGVNSIEPSPATDLFPSWYKKKTGSLKKKVIDRVSNKLATECTPERAKQEINETDADSFSGDTLRQGGNNNNTEEKDDVHKCDDVKPTISFSVNAIGGGRYQIAANASSGTHALTNDRFPGVVSYSLNGTPISNCTSGGQALNGCTVAIVGNTVPTVTFTSSSSGSATISAVIVDSVLYEGANSVTVNLAGGGGGNLTFDSAQIDGASIRFEWSGGSGLVTVRRTSNNASLCQSNGNQCTWNGAMPPGTEVYIRDEDGNEDTATVSP